MGSAATGGKTGATTGPWDVLTGTLLQPASTAKAMADKAPPQYLLRTIRVCVNIISRFKHAAGPKRGDRARRIAFVSELQPENVL
jgi:hypothetical protein